MDLYQSPASALDKLVAHNLQPVPEFTAAVRGALGSLDAALRKQGAPGSQKARVIRIAKGGAYARGTALRGGCDAELVIFLNCFTSFGDQKAGRTETLGAMRASLESWGRHPGPGLTFQISEPKAAGVLQFRLMSADQENWMDVSLVPAFDVLGQPRSGVKPTPEVYSSLLSSGCRDGEHTACFTELRRDFVNTRPIKLKNLILLVKHWYRQVQMQETTRATLPPSYALELLTIFAWEQGCRKDNFSLAQGLRTVLALIQQNKDLCICWTENYSFQDPVVGEFLRRQLKRPRPVILDPADPTWDVGNGTAWRWDVLAKEAESCLNQQCFLQASGVPERPWEGPGLPRAGILGLGHPIQQDNPDHNAVRPRVDSQPLHPAPVLLESATKVPAMPNTTAYETSKNLKKAAPPRTVHETVSKVSSHVSITQSTPSLSVPPTSISTDGSVMGPDLSQIPSKDLDSFIQNHLRPSPQFQQQVRQAIDTILRCLREKCEYRASRVSKGGSFGRGTDLRGGCDVELVIFYKVLRDFKGQRSQQAEILCAIRTQLQSWCQEPVPGLSLQFTEQSRPSALQLRLVSTDLNSWVDISVVPAFDAVGFGEDCSSWIYRDLKSRMDEVRAAPGKFAVCFTTLQQRFFERYPRRVKELILLVKHWYQECEKKWMTSHSPQLSYALELLTVYAWEQGCQDEDFDIAEGVRTVLRLIKESSKLCVYWIGNYDFKDVTVCNTLLFQLRSQRPIILDPTDPTNNVGKDDGSWQLLTEEALAWLYSPSLNDMSPAPYWNVLPTSLFITPSHLLDTFIKDFLQPNEKFLEQIRKAVHIICEFLKNNCFKDSSTKVQKTVKGGSTAKGTALKCGSDADIVVFLSSLKSYDSQKEERSLFVREIRRQLEVFQKTQELEVKFEISKWTAPRVLSFTLKSRSLNESVDFDVLPAYDALGRSPQTLAPETKAYKDLIALCISSGIKGGEFSTCFTELQRKFIKSRPTKLKSLIRLVKHWYKQCERKMKPKASLRRKYALELLTVYAWEHGSGMEDFDTAEGFRTVLDLVIKYRQLCIFWTANYNFEDELIRTFLLTQIQKTRPVILDPADPTGDVGGGDHWHWHLLAKEANEWLSSLCFEPQSGDSGQRVQPWKVPVVQTPGSCGAQI
ncbi:2'-5'-oligoadenylate synthase 3 [Lemmus lemmus]